MPNLFRKMGAYYEKVTMVSYDSLKEQLNLLGIIIDNVANTVFYKLGSPQKTRPQLQSCLKELYSRRNFIAHQFDRTHCDAQILEITRNFVEKLLGDIE